MNEKHTNGNWIVQGNQIVSEAKKRTIAKVAIKIPESERTANAQLIAAAPDLLSALKKFINPTGHTDTCMKNRDEYDIDCTKACKQAREAIKKASGKEILDKLRK